MRLVGEGASFRVWNGAQGCWSACYSVWRCGGWSDTWGRLLCSYCSPAVMSVPTVSGMDSKPASTVVGPFVGHVRRGRRATTTGNVSLDTVVGLGVSTLGRWRTQATCSAATEGFAPVTRPAATMVSSTMASRMSIVGVHAHPVRSGSPVGQATTASPVSAL